MELYIAFLFWGFFFSHETFVSRTWATHTPVQNLKYCYIFFWINFFLKFGIEIKVGTSLAAKSKMSHKIFMWDGNKKKFLLAKYFFDNFAEMLSRVEELQICHLGYITIIFQST